MNKLLKDAIADAKAVRETALANAKATLEEAFAPKLQSMLSHKIKEELDDLSAEEPEEEAEVPPMEGDMEEAARMRKLAGITEEGDEEGEEEAPVAEEPPVEAPPAEDEAPVEAPPVEDEAPPADDMEFSDEDDMEGGEEGEEVSDEELAELIRELEGEDEMETETEDPDMPQLDEAEGDAEAPEEPEAKEEEEEVNLDEIIKALREEDEAEEDKKEEMEESAKVKAELQEAYGVIKFLRSKLNEVNLLNAKLLFVTKLFKKGELNEAQKVRIIETFDRAKSVREAKLIYTTLVESVRTKTVARPVTKKKMTEGLASAPQKKTEIITESNDQYDRFKTLVYFNKNN